MSEDTKGIIRSRKVQKDRQFNGYSGKRTNNDVETQYRKQKTVTRTPQNNNRGSLKYNVQIVNRLFSQRIVLLSFIQMHDCN